MKILKDIGLTSGEVRVYEQLLQIGECPVSVLQKSLNMHPQVTYRTVESLTKKGLAFTVRKKNRMHVSPEHPKKLEEIEKERIAKLRGAIPELVALMKPRRGTIVKTNIGKEALRAFRRFAVDELKRNETLYIIGGSGDRFYAAMEESYADIEQKRIKKRIYKKLLAFPDEREKFLQDKYRLYTEFRYFSSYHPTVSSINIFGNHVGVIVWATEPILIHIQNEEIAFAHKHYFEELWKTAVA